jgi:hypothetical protein
MSQVISNDFARIIKYACIYVPIVCVQMDHKFN